MKVVHENGDKDAIIAMTVHHVYDVANFMSGNMPLDEETIAKPFKLFYLNVVEKKVFFSFVCILLIKILQINICFVD